MPHSGDTITRQPAAKPPSLYVMSYTVASVVHPSTCARLCAAVSRYQRTCPVHNKTCIAESEGTIHIVTGAAGAGFSTNIQPTPPAWIESVNAATHGYIIAHVKERKTLTLDFINANNRTIMDSVTINSKFMQETLPVAREAVKPAVPSE